MKSLEEREEAITQAAEMADVFLKSGKDTLIMTSRQLITGKGDSSFTYPLYLVSLFNSNIHSIAKEECVFYPLYISVGYPLYGKQMLLKV